MLGSFPRPPLRAHTRDPNGHSQVSSARGAPHLPIYVAFNPNEKLHIICALSWPSGGHFVYLMTAILVYKMSNIMFASHMGVYIYENHTWVLPK